MKDYFSRLSCKWGYVRFWRNQDVMPRTPWHLDYLLFKKYYKGKSEDEVYKLFKNLTKA